jgi:hypothetical protein
MHGFRELLHPKSTEMKVCLLYWMIKPRKLLSPEPTRLSLA